MSLNEKFRAFVNVYRKSGLLADSKALLRKKLRPLRNPLAILSAESEEISNKFNGIEPDLKKLALMLTAVSDSLRVVMTSEKQSVEWNYKMSWLSLFAVFIAWLSP